MKLCSQRLPQRTERNGSMPDYSKRENPKPDALSEPEIDIEHVLQRGPVAQAHIDVPGEVDTGVGKVVLFP